MPDPLPARPGNMFDPAHLHRELERVRAMIVRAVLVAHNRRASGEGVHDLERLRRREVELIVRIDAVNGWDLSDLD